MRRLFYFFIVVVFFSCGANNKLLPCRIKGIEENEIVVCDKDITLHALSNHPIYYTIDGSEPNINSCRYSKPIAISSFSGSGEKLLQAIVINNERSSDISKCYFIKGFDEPFDSDLDTLPPSNYDITKEGIPINLPLNLQTPFDESKISKEEYDNAPTPSLFLAFKGTNKERPLKRGTISLTAVSTNEVAISYSINGFAFIPYANEINIKDFSHGKNQLLIKIEDLVTSLVYMRIDTITLNLNAPINMSSWLDSISDDVTLSQLTMPGSHDAGAKYGTIWHKCQNNSYYDQMKMGVRVLDGRVGPNLDVYHGGWRMGSFSTLIDDISIFLSENPSEFIILSLKDENYDGKSKSDWSKGVAKIMDDSCKAITNLKSQDYTVGQLRGGFIILRRYGELYDRGIEPINWPHDSYGFIGGTPPLYIQDAYKYMETLSIAREKKWALFSSTLNLAKESKNDGVIYINFMSATGLSHPELFATSLSSKLRDYLRINPINRYGIIMMDFIAANADVVYRLVLSNNFKHL